MRLTPEASPGNRRGTGVSGKRVSVVFDLDGTLIDSCPGIGASLSAAFRAAGRTMPAADLRAVVGPPIRIIATRLEATLTEAELAQIELTYRAGYDTDGWRETVLFEGVLETLHALQRAATPMYIVTNKPRIPTEKILEHLGLTAIFKEIVTRDSRTPGYASKSEMLASLIERRSLDRQSTVMVGDTVEDGEAAAANGLRFIYATYGYGAVQAPECAMQAFAELSMHLDNYDSRQKNRTLSA